MHIELYRNRTNRLYTEGMLFVNDCYQTNTVEATEIMLPAGTYRVRLGRTPSSRREIVVGETFRLGICHSWIGSKKKRMIAIGQTLFPGAVYLGTEVYNRLIYRFNYAEEKGEESTLTIHDCRQLPEPKPYRHWVTLAALLVSALFPGCGSLRHHPPVEVVKALSHDTVYVSNWHYDSV